ncbi:MAG: hypothetical protein K2J71_00565 [Oscillospiraceae bacterium]|nr:hypothetical protein [Oscillospiraceae bacterium]
MFRKLRITNLRKLEVKHFYSLAGNESKAIREIHDLLKNINTLYLWTEKGENLKNFVSDNLSDANLNNIGQLQHQYYGAVL